MKIEVRELVKSFKRRCVVKGVSLDVSQGEVVGLLGANGAGKTTTFSMIVGLLKPDDGKILLDDKNIARYPNGVMIHEACVKSEEVCPVTGEVFRIKHLS